MTHTSLRMIVLSCFLGLGAIGCTPSEVNNVFYTVCTSISTADTIFQGYAATGRVSAVTIQRERQAVAGAQAVCSGPPPTDTRTAIDAAQRALRAIVDATLTAKKQAGV